MELDSFFGINIDKNYFQYLLLLLNVGNNFKKIIIVYDHFIKWQDDNGIISMSIYDFLLNENSLKEA